MIQLKFCPQCGQETLQWDGVKKWTCSNCNFTLYNNVAGAVAVIIVHQGKIMFTRRNQEPKKDFLDLPGGFVDPEESAEHTCERELYEELKLNIDPEKLKYLGSLPNVYEYKNIDYHTIDLFYEYSLPTMSDLHLEKSEISEVIWIGKNELELTQIAFESQRKFLEKYKNS